MTVAAMTQRAMNDAQRGSHRDRDADSRIQIPDSCEADQACHDGDPGDIGTRELREDDVTYERRRGDRHEREREHRRGGDHAANISECPAPVGQCEKTHDQHDHG